MICLLIFIRFSRLLPVGRSHLEYITIKLAKLQGVSLLWGKIIPPSILQQTILICKFRFIELFD